MMRKRRALIMTVGTGKGRGDKLQAARQQVARILKECGDPLAERLLQFDQEALLKPTLRNHSVLVHGFVARAPGESNPLRRLFREIEAVAVEDAGEEAAARFRTSDRAFHFFRVFLTPAYAG